MVSVLKARWWMVVGTILQGLILRPVLFVVFINNLSDLVKILDDTRLGVGKGVEAASGGWKQGCWSEGQAAERRWQKPLEAKKKKPTNAKSCISGIETAAVQERGWLVRTVLKRHLWILVDKVSMYQKMTIPCCSTLVRTYMSSAQFHCSGVEKKHRQCAASLAENHWADQVTWGEAEREVLAWGMNLFESLPTTLCNVIEEMKLCSSQWKDWRQWNQAAAMEIPMRYSKKSSWWEWSSTGLGCPGAAKSPSLEIFRTWLDNALSILDLALKLFLLWARR